MWIIFHSLNISSHFCNAALCFSILWAGKKELPLSRQLPTAPLTRGAGNDCSIFMGKGYWTSYNRCTGAKRFRNERKSGGVKQEQKIVLASLCRGRWHLQSKSRRERKLPFSGLLPTAPLTRGINKDCSMFIGCQSRCSAGSFNKKCICVPPTASELCPEIRLNFRRGGNRKSSFVVPRAVSQQRYFADIAGQIFPRIFFCLIWL